MPFIHISSKLNMPQTRHFIFSAQETGKRHCCIFGWRMRHTSGDLPPATQVSDRARVRAQVFRSTRRHQLNCASTNVNMQSNPGAKSLTSQSNVRRVLIHWLWLTPQHGFTSTECPVTVRPRENPKPKGFPAQDSKDTSAFLGLTSVSMHEAVNNLLLPQSNVSLKVTLLLWPVQPHQTHWH